MIPIIVPLHTSKNAKKEYFNNDKVENLLQQYQLTNCTKVKLRDEIMENAYEIIKKCIMTNRHHRVFQPVAYDASVPASSMELFQDLFSVAYIQLERTLYKYSTNVHCAKCYHPDFANRSVIRPNKPPEFGIIPPEDLEAEGITCAKCGVVTHIMYRGTSRLFNMWTTIITTSCLAYIKSASSDYRNRQNLVNKFKKREIVQDSTYVGVKEMIVEWREIYRNHKDYLKIINALERICELYAKPDMGIISNLTRFSGVSRAKVLEFLKLVRLTGRPENQSYSGAELLESYSPS